MNKVKVIVIKKLNKIEQLITYVNFKYIQNNSRRFPTSGFFTDFSTSELDYIIVLGNNSTRKFSKLSYDKFNIYLIKGNKIVNINYSSENYYKYIKEIRYAIEWELNH